MTVRPAGNVPPQMNECLIGFNIHETAQQYGYPGARMCVLIRCYNYTVYLPWVRYNISLSRENEQIVL